MKSNAKIILITSALTTIIVGASVGVGMYFGLPTLRTGTTTPTTGTTTPTDTTKSTSSLKDRSIQWINTLTDSSGKIKESLVPEKSKSSTEEHQVFCAPIPPEVRTEPFPSTTSESIIADYRKWLQVNRVLESHKLTGTLGTEWVSLTAKTKPWICFEYTASTTPTTGTTTPTDTTESTSSLKDRSIQFINTFVDSSGEFKREQLTTENLKSNIRKYQVSCEIPQGRIEPFPSTTSESTITPFRTNFQRTVEDSGLTGTLGTKWVSLTTKDTVWLCFEYIETTTPTDTTKSTSSLKDRSIQFINKFVDSSGELKEPLTPGNIKSNTGKDQVACLSEEEWTNPFPITTSESTITPFRTKLQSSVDENGLTGTIGTEWVSFTKKARVWLCYEYTATTTPTDTTESTSSLTDRSIQWINTLTDSSGKIKESLAREKLKSSTEEHQVYCSQIPPEVRTEPYPSTTSESLIATYRYWLQVNRDLESYKLTGTLGTGWVSFTAKTKPWICFEYTATTTPTTGTTTPTTGTTTPTTGTTTPTTGTTTPTDTTKSTIIT